MKKLIHPGIFAIIAIFAITVSSCSKSTNDLVTNEKESIKAPGLPNQGMNPTSPDNFVLGMSDFFPFVNQPIEAELGKPDSYLPVGEFAVFYVLLDPAFAIDPASNATLTTRDDNTGGDIQAYNLISYTEAASYELKIPEELNGQPFMFAIVELNDQYFHKAVTLHSEITVNAEISVAHLDHAFLCHTFIAEHK